jgi:hypothetical protein
MRRFCSTANSANRFVSWFSSTEINDRFIPKAEVSSSHKLSAISLMRITWSKTSRMYRCAAACCLNPSGHGVDLIADDDLSGRRLVEKILSRSSLVLIPR